MEETFKIRAYGYSELAQLYFPFICKKSASIQLTRWIKQNQLITQQLQKAHFHKGQHLLTPRQVQVIVSEFGYP
jgi:hypothetical protein